MVKKAFWIKWHLRWHVKERPVGQIRGGAAGVNGKEEWKVFQAMGIIAWDQEGRESHRAF